MDTIGCRIRNAREALGITQTQLGKLCGTTKQTIFKYENGIVTNIPMDRIEVIAKHLNVSPCYLMGWLDTPDLPLPSLSLSYEEREMIRRFRRLDDRGKSAVLNILEHEYTALPGDNAAATPRQA